jgi:hypothetical protein
MAASINASITTMAAIDMAVHIDIMPANIVNTNATSMRDVLRL